MKSSNVASGEMTNYPVDGPDRSSIHRRASIDIWRPFTIFSGFQKSLIGRLQLPDLDPPQLDRRRVHPAPEQVCPYFIATVAVSHVGAQDGQTTSGKALDELSVEENSQLQNYA